MERSEQAEKEALSMASFTGAPALANEQDAFRDAYAARVQEFTEAGRQAGLTAAAENHESVPAILVDYQHDFVDPHRVASVTGHPAYVSHFLRSCYSTA